MRAALSSYLVVGLVAAAVTVLTVPIFKVVAQVRGYVAQPDGRRVHEAPTASIGGGAMYLGFMVAFSVAWTTGWFEASFSGTSEPFGIVAAATLAYGVGLLDDVREISAPAKTAGIVLASSLLIFGGVSLIFFRIPFVGVTVLSADLGFLLSVVWVLGMTNAVNFIDGLDGLASGIMGIGGVAFFLYATRLTDEGFLQSGNIGLLITAIVIGVCAGFLPWNVHPAKIFMGDGGSLLLGCLMAASTMAVGGRTDDPFSGQTFFFYAPLVIPLVILGVPVIDTVFAIVRRATRRQGLATADMGHLHHRLIRLGHGHRRSVNILWAWTALLSALVLWPVYNEGRGDAIVPIGVLGMAVLLYVSFRPGVGRERPANELDGAVDVRHESDPDGEVPTNVVDFAERRTEAGKP